MVAASFSCGSSVGTPAIAKAMATPVSALSACPATRSRRLLIAAMSDCVAKPRLDSEAVARLPALSEVTTWVGPDCAARLAAEVMPGMVCVWAAVP